MYVTSSYKTMYNPAIETLNTIVPPLYYAIYSVSAKHAYGQPSQPSVKYIMSKKVFAFIPTQLATS